MEGHKTVQQVAAELGISVRRVQAMIKDGRLPAEKFGKNWAIKQENVSKVVHRKVGRPRKADPATGQGHE